MTREKLVEIMLNHTIDTEGIVTTKKALANKILAALEAERVGEVVLAIGKLGTMKGPENTDLFFCLNVQQGVRGQLIFRAMEARK